jgi:hypothetical protein
MNWILEGKRIVGRYMQEYHVTGVVKESRVAYGGRVKHQVKLDNPIVVFGAERDYVSLDETEIQQVTE